MFFINLTSRNNQPSICEFFFLKFKKYNNYMLLFISVDNKKKLVKSIYYDSSSSLF